MDSKEYLTTAEVAQLLKISAGTAQKLARDGRLSAVKVGKLWRFPVQSVTIRAYKQRQLAGREESSAGEKNGWRDFLKHAQPVGFVEPLERGELYDPERS